eukprot:7136581-Prymnesium_polylepis.1
MNEDTREPTRNGRGTACRLPRGGTGHKIEIDTSSAWQINLAWAMADVSHKNTGRMYRVAPFVSGGFKRKT